MEKVVKHKKGGVLKKIVTHSTYFSTEFPALPETLVSLNLKGEII